MINFKKEENLRRYLKPPTYEQIIKRVKKAGVSQRRFEIIYGIPITTIDKIRRGNRELPIHFWHIIYGDRNNKAANISSAPKTKKRTNLSRQVVPKQLLDQFKK